MRLGPLRLGLVFLGVLGCGGGVSIRPATAADHDVAARRFHSGCISPSGEVLVLNQAGGPAGVRVSDGEELWRAAPGRLVYCDEAGAVFTARALENGEPVLQAWLVTYDLGTVIGDESLELHDCRLRGTFYAEARTAESDAGFSWMIISYWEGGYPPSPEEEAAADCDERGTVRIDRESGELSASSFVSLEAPTNDNGPLTAGAIQIVQHLYRPDGACGRGDDVPPDEQSSWVAAVQDGTELWRRPVPNLQGDDDCRP